MDLRQLTQKDLISPKNITQLGTLLYDTDPYISPCLCTRADAHLLGQLCVSGLDPLFALSNCFVAIEAQDDIVGLILWHQGPLPFWEPAPLRKMAAAAGITLSPQLDLAAVEYFSSYAHTPPDEIAIINVCVEESQRGHGVGKELLSRFLALHGEKTCELFVLADNEPAISLYLQHGFSIKETQPAFAPNSSTPVLSHKMLRIT